MAWEQKSTRHFGAKKFVRRKNYIILRLKGENCINKREYTDEQIELITKTPYVSSTILSKQLGIPASSIRGFRNRQGIKTRCKLGYVSKEEFIANYEKLQSEQKMAKLYNVNRHAINNYSKLIGFDDSIYKRKSLTNEQIKYIVDNYNNKSHITLAEELNVAPSAVRGVWHRNTLTGKTRRTYTLSNEDYFSKIDSQDKAYFLGFIGSDGCIYKTLSNNKQNILRISIQKEDENILHIFRKYLGTDKPILETTNEKNTYVSLEICSNKICSDIESLGLSNRKTYDNTIANVDEAWMPALIRGYFDGDGSIGYNKSIFNSSISIAGYESNMKKIMNFLQNHNIYGGMTIDKRKTNIANDGSKFCIFYLANKTSKYSFLKLIYENNNCVYLERKYKRACDFINAIENSENIRDKQIVNYYQHAVKLVS